MSVYFPDGTACHTRFVTLSGAFVTPAAVRPNPPTERPAAGLPLNRSLESIYLSHRQALFSLALLTTGCAAMAEDAIHEAFVRLCRSKDLPGDLTNQQSSLNQPPDSADLVSYIFTAVRNAAIDAGRRQQTQQKLAQSIFQMQSAKSTDGDSEREDRAELLRSAVEALEQPSREVVIMKVYGGLTFEQIGQVLEIPGSTAATRYRRALSHIEDSIRKHT